MKTFILRILLKWNYSPSIFSVRKIGQLTTSTSFAPVDVPAGQTPELPHSASTQYCMNSCEQGGKWVVSASLCHLIIVAAVVVSRRVRLQGVPFPTIIGCFGHWHLTCWNHSELQLKEKKVERLGSTMKRTCAIVVLLLISWTAPSFCILCNVTATGLTPIVMCPFFFTPFTRIPSFLFISSLCVAQIVVLIEEFLQIDFQIGQTYKGYPGFLYNDSNTIPSPWLSAAQQLSSKFSVKTFCCFGTSLRFLWVVPKRRFNLWMSMELLIQTEKLDSPA